jgi:hypothetical protein
MVGIRRPKGAAQPTKSTVTTSVLRKCEDVVMEPKKEHTEHEENGYRETHETYDDPETNTHVEEVKIERIKDDSCQEK